MSTTPSKKHSNKKSKISSSVKKLDTYSSDNDDKSETSSTTSEAPSDTTENNFEIDYDEKPLPDKVKSFIDETTAKISSLQEEIKKLRLHKQKLTSLFNEIKKLIPKKGMKDPNAPKRALNPYMFFGKEVRQTIRDENPEMKMTEISKKIGVMWKELSEEDKVKYNDLAEKDKERYLSEKAKYDSKKSQSQSQSQSQSSDDETVVLE